MFLSDAYGLFKWLTPFRHAPPPKEFRVQHLCSDVLELEYDTAVHVWHVLGELLQARSWVRAEAWVGMDGIGRAWPGMGTHGQA